MFERKFVHFEECKNCIYQKSQIDKAREKPPTLRWFKFFDKVQKLRDFDRLF